MVIVTVPHTFSSLERFHIALAGQHLDDDDDNDNNNNANLWLSSIQILPRHLNRFGYQLKSESPEYCHNS